MLPDYLVSVRYWAATCEKSLQATLQTQRLVHDDEEYPTETGKTMSLQDYEAHILSTLSWAGQSCNTLLEEQDRHVRQRLFCAARLETFVAVLNTLMQQGLVSAEELRALTEEKNELVAENGEKIWLNLITKEKKSPLFYQLQDVSR